MEEFRRGGRRRVEAAEGAGHPGKIRQNYISNYPSRGTYVGGLPHWAHDVSATLNQRQWRWFNVAITSCAKWELRLWCARFQLTALHEQKLQTPLVPFSGEHTLSSHKTRVIWWVPNERSSASYQNVMSHILYDMELNTDFSHLPSSKSWYSGAVRSSQPCRGRWFFSTWHNVQLAKSSTQQTNMTNFHPLEDVRRGAKLKLFCHTWRWRFFTNTKKWFYLPPPPPLKKRKILYDYLESTYSWKTVLPLSCVAAQTSL